RRRVVESLDAEREAHAPLRAELVDEQPVLTPLRMLEQERRAVRADRARDDLCDLEVRIDLGVDPHELSLALEQRDPLAKVVCGHQYGRSWRLRSRRRSARCSTSWPTAITEQKMRPTISIARITCLPSETGSNSITVRL